jgi:acyl carrier protein
VLSTLVMLALISTAACRMARDKSRNDNGNSTSASSEGASSLDRADIKIERKVRRLIADELGIEEDDVGLDANLVDDLDADELDRVSVVMRLEEEFDLAVPDEDVERMRTVRDLCDYVKQHHKK